MSPEIRRVRQGALLIGFVFIVSVVGHHLIAGQSLLESIHWTVITLSTVGYGDRPSESVGSAELVFTIVVIVVGTVSVGYTVGVLLQAAIEGQIEDAVGVRRMNRDIGRQSNHVVICGFGRIGQYLAERLSRQQLSVVVVDADPDAVAEAKDLGYLCLEGDATSEDVLIEAGIVRARTLVVALQSDADNVFLTLTARNLCPEINIIARGEQPATEKKLLQAGANQVVLPAVIGAHHMADLIMRPHAATLMYGVRHQPSLDADMAELEIPDDSPLVGKTIRDAGTRKKDSVLIVAVRRPDGEQFFNPDAEYEFHAGDTLIVIGKTEAVRGFQATYGVAKLDSVKR